MAIERDSLLGRAFVAGALASLALAGCEGPQGEMGPAGAQGAAGPAGQDGRDGAAGKDGADGLDGSDGASGNDGTDGADGSDGADGFGARSLQFEDVGFPWTNAEKHQARASGSVTVNGKRHEIGYNVILRGGKDPELATDVASASVECDLENRPESCFGVIMDTNYEPLLDGNGQPQIAASNDFSSLLEVEGNLFAVNHFESNPSGWFVTRVNQDEDGALEAAWTRAIDLSGVDGAWISCAGSVTPWGTHLGSEEYPPDAKPMDEAMVDFATFDASSARGSIDPIARYKGFHPVTADNFAAFKDEYSSYFHGYPIEVRLDADGNPDVTKHYTMGRVAIELPYVMPDQRTAYITDDGGNVGLFMFVADRAGDLSSGRLYAARIHQTSQPGGQLHGDVQWIDMGHATNDEIRAHLHPLNGEPTKFSDIFATEAPVDDACPTEGFVAVRAGSSSLQCLKLKPGMAVAASRLETRRYAAYLGATTEFNKEEGITFDGDRGRLYLAMSDVNGAMEGQSVIDHINVAENRCGVVYALDTAPLVDVDGNLVSEYAAQNIYPFVAGTSMSYPSDSPYAGNSCSVNGIANPDNVTYLDGYDTLVIGEDTGRHQNDAIWSVNVVDRKMTRIFTTPYGAETTSPYWFPDVGGYGYLMAVIQHPYGESDQGTLGDAEATGKASWMGVVGPFPSLALD